MTDATTILSPVRLKFILHWGEMGTRWGIVKRVHALGDTRYHFESLNDVWEMFRVVMDERKKREFDPTEGLVCECLAEAVKNEETNEYTTQKLHELAGFFDTTSTWYGQVPQWPTSTLTKFIKASDRIRKLPGIGG